MLEMLLKRIKRAKRRSRSRLRKSPGAAKPFGWAWERKFLGKHLTAKPSDFHTQLIDDLAGFHESRGQRKVYRGPRGSGKTAHISNAYPLWCVCENAERFILLLAETGDQAKVYLSEIKTELEGNERLAKAYPHATGVGPVWRDSKIVTRNGVCVVARGTAGRVLGLKHAGTRPTLVIGDDLNQRGDAYSPTMRRRKVDWLMKDVMKVGTPKTNFLVAGTSIHREAIVCELSRNPAWSVRRYKSIVRWPDRMDLWAQWESIFANIGDEGRRDRARQFYESHSIEMNAGAVVLWPDRYSLYDLMCDRAESGPGPFASERQDEEGTDGATEWPSEYFDRPDLWFHEWPDDLVCRTLYLDPSKGKGDGKGDYQAHVWGGWSVSKNAMYVQADLRHDPGPDMLAFAIETASRFGANTVVVEQNSDNMALMPAEFQRQRERLKSGCELFGITSVENKLTRIRTNLTPYLSRGQIKVRNTGGGKMLVDQLRDFPSGEYDDGCDAMAGLFAYVIKMTLGG